MPESARFPLMPTIGPGDILPFAAARDAQGVALVTETATLTYGDLERLSRECAAALQQRGIGPGDVVSLFGQNAWEWVVAYHGVLRAGAVVNPVNVMLTAPELAYVLADCGSRVLIVGAEQVVTARAAVAATPHDVGLVEYGNGAEAATSFGAMLADGARLPFTARRSDTTDLCSISYTSGTTGHPKGALQSNRAVLLNCALTATMHGRSHDDTVVTALPTAHVYGNVAVNSIFMVGGRVVLMERFNPAQALQCIASERATMFEGVPAMYSMLLAEPSIGTTDLASIRMCTVGGQTFSAELTARWEQLTGAPLIELWGMTELSGLGTTHSPLCPQVPGSVGVALPGMDLRIAALDGSGRSLPAGEHGELQIRGPIVMLGYHANPGATAEALDDDGWLHTGDVAHRDETGHVFVVDRMKDVIITAGYNVYPAEIERVVSDHPDVALVGVGARPDTVRGEVAVAYVVAKPATAPTAESIMEFCRTRLAAYKRPREVVFVAELPATPSGKIMRRRLRQLSPGRGKDDVQA